MGATSAPGSAASQALQVPAARGEQEKVLLGKGATSTAPALPSPCLTPSGVPPAPAGLEKVFFCLSVFPLGDFCLLERFETSHIFLYK